MKDSLVKYEEYLKYELNYSDKTITEYLLHLNKYNEYINRLNINYLKITKDEIIDMLKYFDILKYSSRTISNILSSLRSFYDYLLDQEIIKTNIFKLISNPKIDKKLPNFLSYEEMRVILDSIEEDTFLKIRNKFIVELLYATGIRVSELVNIKLSDINYSSREIRIFGKGKKERIVYYGECAEIAMQKYFKLKEANCDYLIVNNQGNKITTRGIEKIIDNVTLKACIKNNVTPHTFRHTFATHLLNAGSDIKSVQELLGHESLNTTEVYTHVTDEYLKNIYRKSMPR